MLVAFLVVAIFTGCAQQQQTLVERNNAISRTDKSNYYEAQQISDIEAWKDNPGKIVNLYIINPVTGGLLVPAIQCKGVPASSTESLEPNEAVPWTNATSWFIDLDGVDGGTTEMAGRDGTFGEPVAFRQCMTVDGNYIDFPGLGLPYLVSSASYTFADATVKRDFEAEARLLAAEQIIERGGCINVETLLEIPCS